VGWLRRFKFRVSAKKAWMHEIAGESAPGIEYARAPSHASLHLDIVLPHLLFFHFDSNSIPQEKLANV
jgi:hypothetical protein